MSNHVIEEKLNAIKDRLTDLEDLQLVNKLDLVNLKNELERMKLSFAPSPETERKISELTRLAETIPLKNLEKLAGEIDTIKSELKIIKPKELEEFKRRTESLDKGLKQLESRSVTIPQLERHAAQIEELRSTIVSLPEEIAPKLNKLREELATLKSSVSPEMLKRIQEFGKLTQEIDRVKSDLERIRPEKIEEYAAQIKELRSSLAALPKGAVTKEVVGELKKAIEANKEKIEKMASLKAKGIPVEELVSIKAKLEEFDQKLKSMKIPKVEGIKKMAEDAIRKNEERIVGIEQVIASLPKMKIKEELDQKIDKLKSEFAGKEELEGLIRRLDNLKGSLTKRLNKEVAARFEGLDEKSKRVDALKKEIGERIKDIEGLKESLIKRQEEKFESLKFRFGKIAEEVKKRGIDDIETNKRNIESLWEELKKLRAFKKGLIEQGEKIKGLADLKEKLTAEQKAKLKQFDLKLEEWKKNFTTQGEKVLADLKGKVESILKEILTKQKEAAGKLVDEKLASKIGELKSKIASVENDVKSTQINLLDSIKGSKENKARLDAMGKWKTELVGIKKQLEKIDVKTLEEDERQRKRLELEIKSLGEKIEGMTELQKTIPELGITNLRRDLETLKVQQQWLTNNFEKFNLKPIYERIEELEKKIKAMRLSSALVIE